MQEFLTDLVIAVEIPSGALSEYPFYHKVILFESSKTDKLLPISLSQAFWSILFGLSKDFPAA